MSFRRCKGTDFRTFHQIFSRIQKNHLNNLFLKNIIPNTLLQASPNRIIFRHPLQNAHKSREKGIVTYKKQTTGKLTFSRCRLAFFFLEMPVAKGQSQQSHVSAELLVVKNLPHLLGISPYCLMDSEPKLRPFQCG